MPTDGELMDWEGLKPDEVNPKEFVNNSFGAFKTSASPSSVFLAFFEYLKSQGVTPKVDNE